MPRHSFIPLRQAYQNTMNPTTPTSLQDPKRGTTLLAVFFFILLQLITGLVEATYAFGLLSVDIPPETVFVLFLFAPVLLLIYPRVLDGRTGQIFTVVTSVLATVSWPASMAFDPRGKMIFCGLGAGAGLLALAGMLRQTQSRAAIPALGISLGFASLASILLRTVYYGNEVFSSGPPLARIGMAILVPAQAYFLTRWLLNQSPAENPLPAPPSRPGFGRVIGLCLGLFSVLALVYFAFASPVVIVRWSGGSDLWITIAVIAALVLLLLLWPTLSRARFLQSPRIFLGWNLLFALALGLTLLLYSVPFPASADGFPFEQSDPGIIGQVALFAMLLLHPVIYLDFGLLAKTLGEEKPAPRTLAGGFALGAVSLVLLIFAQIFTTVYDYIPVIGPWFRDRFWLVVTLPAAVMALAVFLARGGIPAAFHERRRWSISFYLGMFIGIPLIFLVFWTAGAYYFPEPQPAAPKTSLRVVTYNLQQGYNNQGQKSFDEQYRVLIQDADIIGLQETDTARIAGGNSDLVRYLADQMNMYSYYGPRTTSGTFGIALLSRYPIQDARTFFMYSEGEQTAAIRARITVGGKTFTVLVTHLGNDGPLIQQQQVLEGLQGQENIIAMGDFNFRSDSESYRQTVAVLEDGWELAQEKDFNQKDDPSRRIDHFFLSPDLLASGVQIRRATYLPKGPSDHPGMVIELGW